MNKTKGFVALLTTGFIISFFGILIRLLNQDLYPYQQLFFRYSLGFVLVFSLALITKVSWSINSLNKRDLFLNCLCSALSVLFFTLSILYTKVSVTIFSLYIGSLTTSFLTGKLLFKEKITHMKIISLVFVILGLVFFVYPFSLSTINNGLFFGIGAGVLESLTFLFRKKLGNKIARLTLVSFQLLGGAVASLIFVLFSKEFVVSHFSVETIVVTLLFALCLISINYLIIIGFSNFDLSLGNIIISSELVFAPLLAFLFLKEVPTFYQVIGGASIIVAVVAPNLGYKKTRKGIEPN